jgi:hypothetical protein
MRMEGVMEASFISIYSCGTNRLYFTAVALFEDVAVSEGAVDKIGHDLWLDVKSDDAVPVFGDQFLGGG